MSILMVQPGAIGDVILSLPAIRTLREKFGRGRMEIWAERNVCSLLAHPAYADRVVALADTGFDSYPLPQRTLEALRRFDQVVSWRGAKLPELVDAVAAAHPAALFLPQFPPSETPVHLTEFRRLQLFAAIGENPAEYPEMLLTDGDRAFADQYRGATPLVIIHPGASGAAKRWDPAGFAAVARHCINEWGARILISEGPLDHEAVEAVCREAAFERLRLDDLRQVAAVLSAADLFIGNDCGITHMAAAVGTPAIAIFQSTDPRLWAPRGQHVRVLVRPAVAEVMAVAKEHEWQQARV